MRRHNDYEIIDRIQEGDEDALALLLHQYRHFMAKKIHKFNLAYDFDNLFQECLIILHRSAMRFDASFNKTFTRFLEMNIERYFISHIATLKRRKETTMHYLNDIAERNHCLREASAYYSLHVAEIEKVLTPFEYRVYTLRELKNYGIDAIVEKESADIKSVYNALHRAKAKIKAYFSD